MKVLFDKLRTEHEDLEVILLTGDYIAHAVALEYPPAESFYTASYEDLLAITKQVANLFHEYFPYVVVLPTMGNNDTKYHY